MTAPGYPDILLSMNLTTNGDNHRTTVDYTITFRCNDDNRFLIQGGAEYTGLFTFVVQVLYFYEKNT